MKRHLLWVLMVAWLCTGCAVRPASEAEVLASTIAREPPRQISCGISDVRYCDVDVDGQRHCACVDNRALFHPR
jgi:hypothetical protein